MFKDDNHDGTFKARTLIQLPSNISYTPHLGGW